MHCWLQSSHRIPKLCRLCWLCALMAQTASDSPGCAPCMTAGLKNDLSSHANQGGLIKARGADAGGQCCVCFNGMKNNWLLRDLD